MPSDLSNSLICIFKAIEICANAQVFFCENESLRIFHFSLDNWFLFAMINKHCGCGETGRHADFRGQWGDSCRFESCHPHYKYQTTAWFSRFYFRRDHHGTKLLVFFLVFNTILLMKEFVLNSYKDLIQAVSHFGFLPFFANEIEGLSVEEMTPNHLWFSDVPGPWDWKGPVISEGKCVYGKFFEKKAGFVSNRWFCDFANIRRDGYDFDARFEDGLASHAEEYLYSIISSRHSILSKDAKIIGGYMKPRDVSRDSWQPRKGFDTQITRLQMECYVITSNFEYETGKNGQPYGWGIARYATPEMYLGKPFSEHVYDRSVENSRKRILRHLQKVLPDVETVYLERLIG